MTRSVRSERAATQACDRGGVLVVMLIVAAALALVALLWIVSQRPKTSESEQSGGNPAADQLAREKTAAWFAKSAANDTAGALDEAEKALAPLLARKTPAIEDLISGAILARTRYHDRVQDHDAEARKLLARVLEREPDNARAHYMLGYLERLEGKFALAEEHLRAVLKSQPDDLPTKLALAQVIEEKTPKEADALYRSVIGRGVDNAGSWYVTAVFRLAGLMRDLGRDDESERFLGEFQTLLDRGLNAPKQIDEERGNLGNLGAPPPLPIDVAVVVSVPTLGFQETILPELAGFERLRACDLDGDEIMDLVGFGARGITAAVHGRDGTWRAQVLVTGQVDWLITADLTPLSAKAAGEPPSLQDVIASRGKDLVWLRASRDERGQVSWKQEAKPIFSLSSQPRDGLAFDFDHEGDLDLAVVGDFGLRILRNDGARSDLPGAAFTDVTQQSGAPLSRPFAWIISEDFDTDQDVDLLCGGPRDVLMLSNLRGGKLASVTDERLKNFAVTPIRPLCADLDADGRPDLWGAGPYSLLYLNQASTMFRPEQSRGLVRAPESLLAPAVAAEPWAGKPPRELLPADFDGDGLLDAAWLNVDAPDQQVLSAQLAIGRLGQQGFDLVLSKTKSSSQPAIADLDGDAVPEVLVTSAEGLLVSRLTVPEHSSLRLSLRGKKDNRRGVGAVVESRAGGNYQRTYWRGEPTALGLGAATSVDWLRVTWPNGVIQYDLQPEPGSRTITQREGLEGSCPFLYAWDGSKYDFVSDVLGITPLGLPMEPDMLVPPDHDEFVLIRGEQLAAKDGRYEVQLTEELREVTYLDRLRLDVVDHPEGTEIFPNELFCFPPFPLPHVHTLRAPLSPVRAVTSDGRDCTQALARIDNEYTGPTSFAPSQFLGLCPPHWVELEFDAAQLASANKLRLFLTGWFYWTDASVNMSSARDPSFEFIPPIFQVPDGQGGWKDAGPPVGFPAGKTKTMVVDVSDLLPRADPRLRIFTSLRLYWDAVRLAVDDDDAELHVTPIEPASAELWRRGFSELIQDERPEQPARFQWNRLAPRPRWNPHPGFYTKYGETLPLISAIDDQFVVMGSGDALHVEFDASLAPPLPAGWRRDFLLFLDGWAKDRDPNTVSALHVEPLPFHGMTGYPYGKDEEFPRTPETKAWKRQWQTRMPEPWIR